MSNARSISKLAALAVHVSNLIGLSNNKANIDAAAASAGAPSFPSGTVLDFAGPEGAVPSGFLICDGRAVSRTTYSTLFNVIGTTHGVGDGASTFNLPDARGRVVAGKDNMGGTAANRLTTAGGGVNGATLGSAGGAESVTLTGAQSGLPAHGHTASSTHALSTNVAGSHSHGYTSPSGGFNVGVGDTTYYVMPGADTTGAAGDHSHSITGSISTTVNNAAAANASQAHTNTQPTIIFNKIIKT